MSVSHEQERELMQGVKPDSLSERIKALVSSLDIDIVGFADASKFDGYRQRDSIRRDPRISLPGAKSIIVVGVYIGGVALPAWNKPTTGRTSRLFLSGYFNDVVKELTPVARLLEKEGFVARICDDSSIDGSIVPLKLAAIRAGLGWQGKNSLLINRKYGTFLALGGIITDAVLEHNKEKEPNHCKTCTRCQDKCPVRAIDQAHVLDRTKCLSYLLQNEDLPDQARDLTQNRVMDCEICQEVCPWNSKHLHEPILTNATMSFQKQIGFWEDFFDLPRLADLTEREYMESLGKLNTGISYSIFRRNVRNAFAELRKTALN